MFRAFTTGIISCFIASSLCHAQNELNNWTKIGSEDGLSDRTINEIIRDHEGYLWFGTRNGLNRYDGLNIVSYTTDPKSQTRISVKDVHKVASRITGEIIVQYGPNGFVDVLTGQSTIAQKIFFSEENGIQGRVKYVDLDEKTGDLHLLVERDSALSVFSLGPDLTFNLAAELHCIVTKPSSNYQLLVSSPNEYWLADDQIGLLHLDDSGQIISTISYDTLGLSTEAGEVDIFHQDRLGRLWLSFQNSPGLWEYNNAANLFTPVFIDEAAANRWYVDLWEDAQGNVIVAQGDDPTLVNGEIKHLYLIKADDVAIPYDGLLSRTKEINEIYSVDFERLVFMGTDGGVQKVNLTKQRVKKYLASEDTESWGISLRGICGLPDGQVMFSHETNTWYQFDPHRDSITTINIDLPRSKEPAYCGCARELLYDEEGFVWGIRYSEAYKTDLIRYSLKDSSFTSFSFPHKIQSLIMGQDRRIWMVSGEKGKIGRLSYFNRATRLFHHYFTADGLNPLEEIVPTFLFQSNDGSMWIGSTSGLFHVDIENGQYNAYRYSDQDYYGINSNIIHCITEDHQNQIWIGTDAGVNIFDPEQKTFHFYDVRDGLAGNNVCGIIEDGKNNFWLSTFSGLSYFNDEINSFRNFSVADGFSHEEFNRYSYYRDPKDGNIYFGGVNGLNVFNPNELLERDLSAPILLSELSYYDKEEGAIVDHLHNLQNVKEVRLSASNRYFRCKFALSDYSYPHLNRFKYRLEGLDIDWNYIGTQNELTFNNLPAGNYVLHIVGADRNLNESSLSFQLPIKVEDFFYRKSWFLALCLLLISLTIYLFHRIKLQQAINMERLRTKISSDLHDDVGGLLSGLAMQTELLQYSAKEKDKPKLERISAMSRNAMAQMRDVIWATDARKDKFDDLLTRMKEFAAEILFPRGINCDFTVSYIQKERKIPVQVRQNLYLIFKEAVTNVAKHSDATQVNVNFKKEGARFFMSIADNGSKSVSNGKPKSSLNGSGLKNIEMRAEHINADLKIDKEAGYNIALEMKSFI